ncbi:MAG: uroporphyrinogen decarboxylase family protein [Kiritimatiellia bacterium]|nr:uroporphyrinogen-III decarboxylase-like protein [Lentisphaerota bacterium]
MTRREIVQSTLAFKKAPTPYNIDFTGDMRARLAAHFGRADVDEAVGNYFLCINVGSNAGAEVNRVAGGLMQPLGAARFQDEFGVIWDKSAGDDIGVVANQVLPEPDISRLHLPDPTDGARWQGYEQVRQQAGDRYVLACFSSPLFQRAWFLRGMGALLEDLALNDAFVHDLLDRLMQFSLGVVDGIISRGADGVIFYDDYAQQSGLLFSPAMFREFFAPRLASICQRVRAAGLDVFFHSCGNVTDILDDLHACGVQVFNPLQPEVMDIAALAAQYAGKLAFYGGISTQQTMPYGQPDDVRREATSMLALFRPQGGYILAPAHALQKDVPLENVLALLAMVRAENDRLGY